MTFESPMAKNPAGAGDWEVGGESDFLGAGDEVGLRGDKIDCCGEMEITENQKNGNKMPRSLLSSLWLDASISVGREEGIRDGGAQDSTQKPIVAPPLARRNSSKKTDAAKKMPRNKRFDAIE
ncbi:MAG: hypothetical protein ABFC77_16490 [Thermoguttaceae bacterium]